MLVFLDGKKTKVIQFLKLSQIMYSLKSCFTFLEFELCLSISTNACIIFSHNLKKVIYSVSCWHFSGIYLCRYKRLSVMSQEPLKHISKHEQSFNVAKLMSSLANFHLLLKVRICTRLLIKLFFTNFFIIGNKHLIIKIITISNNLNFCKGNNQKTKYFVLAGLTYSASNRCKKLVISYLEK